MDTGREMPTTWEYLNQVTGPKMKEIGIEVHRVKAAEYANNWGHPSLNGWGLQGTLLLPAFTDKGKTRQTVDFVRQLGSLKFWPDG